MLITFDVGWTPKLPFTGQKLKKNLGDLDWKPCCKYKVVDRDRWFYAEGVYNTADISTRVVSCKESLRKWFDGPEIL